MDFAVGSFPYESWAWEVSQALASERIASEVEAAGPRAYQVLVDESDSDRAGELLATVGYMTCPVGASLGSPGSVKDWFPEGRDEESRDRILSLAQDKLEEMANASAAMAWSTPPDEGGDEEYWVLATFGYESAVNGDLVDELPPPPAGYRLTDRGGTIPTTEEHVGVEHLIRAVAREMKRKDNDREVADVIHSEYGEGEIPVSVSGESEVYARTA